MRNVDWEDFQHRTIQYIRDKKNRHKRGVLFAGVHPLIPNKVCIGFSLTHSKLDEFDKVKKRKGDEIIINNQDGLGKTIAARRSVKWLDQGMAFIDRAGNGLVPIPESDQGAKILVPQSISEDLKQFVQRCERYYRDKELPPWTEESVFLIPNMITKETIEFRHKQIDHKQREKSTTEFQSRAD